MFRGNEKNVAQDGAYGEIGHPKGLRIDITVHGAGEKLGEGRRADVDRRQRILLQILASPAWVVVMHEHAWQISHGKRHRGTGRGVRDAGRRDGMQSWLDTWSKQASGADGPSCAVTICIAVHLPRNASIIRIIENVSGELLGLGSSDRTAFRTESDSERTLHDCNRRGAGLRVVGNRGCREGDRGRVRNGDWSRIGDGRCRCPRERATSAAAATDAGERPSYALDLNIIHQLRREKLRPAPGSNTGGCRDDGDGDGRRRSSAGRLECG